MPGRTPDRFAQLQWLVRLRWYALIGVTLACSLGVLGLVPGINLPVMALAIVLGIGTNLWVLSASHKDDDTDAAHVGQALFDIGALTLVLWAAGGLTAPSSPSTSSRCCSRRCWGAGGPSGRRA